METEKFLRLITQYVNRQASNSEMEELAHWLENKDNYDVFVDFVKTNYLINLNMGMFDAEDSKKQLLELINKEKRSNKRKQINTYFKYAAVLVVVLTVGGYFFKDSFVGNNVSNDEPAIVNTNIIEPGVDKAVLTLDDGSEIELGKNNNVATQNASSNGEDIIYASNENVSKKVEYNYLTIPRGGQFHVVLSDKTQVWLNSESQLKFPVNFIDGEPRVVELVYGEAYFDVSPSIENKDAKFIVKNQWQEIEVLGTEFNLKAYRDESNIYTTLVEGKVTINRNGASQSLKPSQQSNLFINSNSLTVKKVDVKAEIAWKDGLFYFVNKPLKEIMKVISRWYDIEVIFKNKDLETIEFIGTLDKNQSIEEILQIMKSNSLNSYEIIDKTIILE